MHQAFAAIDSAFLAIVLGASGPMRASEKTHLASCNILANDLENRLGSRYALYGSIWQLLASVRARLIVPVLRGVLHEVLIGLEHQESSQHTNTDPDAVAAR